MLYEARMIRETAQEPDGQFGVLTLLHERVRVCTTP